MKKLSIHSDQFRQPIARVIDRGKKVVIWHQFSRSGGLQEWFLIHGIDSLDEILSRGHVASAFTAYEWIEVLAPRTVDHNWLDRVSSVLQKETQDRMLLIQPILSNETKLIQLTWIGEFVDIQEYLEQHIGSEVVVGRIPPGITSEIVRGYYPDKAGILQSGTY